MNTGWTEEGRNQIEEPSEEMLPRCRYDEGLGWMGSGSKNEKEGMVMRTVQTFNLQDFQIRYEDAGIHAIGGREVRIIPRFRASLPVASSPFTAHSSSPVGLSSTSRGRCSLE